MHKILVIDDEKNIRLTLRRSLEAPDFIIDDALSGEEALSKIESNKYDLLLLDLKLPGINGIEILKAVHSKYPELKVIIISAHGSIQTAVEAMKVGALDFLEKPFTPADIRQLVKKALSQ